MGVGWIGAAGSESIYIGWIGTVWIGTVWDDIDGNFAGYPDLPTIIDHPDHDDRP